MGGRYAIRRLVVGSVMALGLELLSGCAAGRPTSLIRLPEGYEVLTAHCQTSSELCQRIQVTGDPADEEAWGFRARPAATALFTEWGRVTVTWWTHKIRGLHRNDFIMAAKTDALGAESGHITRDEIREGRPP